MSQALVAQLCIDLGHDRLAGCCFTRLEFQVETFRPILLIHAILEFKFFAQFCFTFVTVTGEAVLDFCFTGVTVGAEFMLHSVFEFNFDFSM